MRSALYRLSTNLVRIQRQPNPATNPATEFNVRLEQCRCTLLGCSHLPREGVIQRGREPGPCSCASGGCIRPTPCLLPTAAFPVAYWYLLCVPLALDMRAYSI